MTEFKTVAFVRRTPNGKNLKINLIKTELAGHPSWTEPNHKEMFCYLNIEKLMKVLNNDQEACTVYYAKE